MLDELTKVLSNLELKENTNLISVEDFGRFWLYTQIFELVYFACVNRCIHVILLPVDQQEFLLMIIK